MWASDINEEMKVAAAEALAGLVAMSCSRGLYHPGGVRFRRALRPAVAEVRLIAMTARLRLYVFILIFYILIYNDYYFHIYIRVKIDFISDAFFVLLYP